MEYVLEMSDIVKEFYGVRVLERVQFQLRAGEIHALCGENGAGKSTLMKILSGAYPCGQYEGDILMEGIRCQFRNTRESAAAGIEIIYQELEVAPNLTVAENIFLGHEPRRSGLIDYEKMTMDSSDILKRLNIDINPNEKVEELGVGMRQMVVIAKSLLKNPKVLIMDEPSAALTKHEVESMLKIVRQLTEEGVAIVYISHRLEEVMQIADRITVLRDGHTVCTEERKNMDVDTLIRYMVGRELKDQFVRNNRNCSSGEILLKVNQLSAEDETNGKAIVRNISFNVYKGEILGIAGLMGAGRTETVLAMMGALPRAKVTGEMMLEGRPLTIKSPEEAIRAGLFLVVEDRKEKGLVLGMDIKNNVILSSLKQTCHFGVINQNEAIKQTGKYIDELRIKAHSMEMFTASLSGGNQQKVVLAKALMTQPKVLILDEPTRGVDVGAKHEIYQIMDRLCAQGIGIIMISSELPEILAMADRILVMNQGRISGEIDNTDMATQEQIMSLCTAEG